jgi:hypothetical protein
MVWFKVLKQSDYKYYFFVDFLWFYKWLIVYMIYGA